MGLSKYKIGELISVVDERNNLGIHDFYGININKEFMPTAANTEGLDESKYKIVKKGCFVYSGMQTGRDRCIRISMYNEEKPILVSPAYTTFEVFRTDIILPLYFFMIFLSKEMDRYGAFCSDGSIRSNLDWDVFCDIEINIPPLEIQQKYVDIYRAMVENQESYERGLEDLKLVCDAYIEDLRKQKKIEAIGKYIQESNHKNVDLKFGIDDVRGISIDKRLISTKANMNGVPLKGYKIVAPRHFAYVPVTSRNGNKISLAFNCSNESYVVSSTYITFFCLNNEKLLPEYLCMFFDKNSFDRYARFNSWGSARETFLLEDLKKYKIPIPEFKIQQSIVNIYNSYIERKVINEKLKAQIKDICPILIKGSIEEARGI